VGRETTLPADDAEELLITRSRKSALPADTGRLPLYEDILGTRKLLGINFLL
jgi:hypothetical protein